MLSVGIREIFLLPNLLRLANKKIDKRFPIVMGGGKTPPIFLCLVSDKRLRRSLDEDRPIFLFYNGVMLQRCNTTSHKGKE